MCKVQLNIICLLLYSLSKMDQKRRYLRKECQNRYVDSTTNRSLIACVCILVYKDEEQMAVNVKKDLKTFIKKRKDLVAIVVCLIEGTELKDAIRNICWENLSEDVQLHIIATFLGAPIYVLRNLRGKVYWEYCPPLLGVQQGRGDVPPYITVTEDSGKWYPVKSTDRHCGSPVSFGYIGVQKKILEGFVNVCFNNTSLSFNHTLIYNSFWAVFLQISLVLFSFVLFEVTEHNPL